MGNFSAIGCHIFAGGFTAGVKRVFDVPVQLELHGLGVETTERVWKVPVILVDDVKDWPPLTRDVLFGNPRCTGFSCVTAGHGEDTHGPWAKQCQDVHDFMTYGLANNFPVIVWESVQQAYSVGKPLLDLWTERCVAKGYRIAHVFVNSHTFGNSQNRKRYFYVAYPRSKQFNANAPQIYPYYSVLYDAIWERRDRVTNKYEWDSTDYDQDSCLDLIPDEWHSIPSLPTGWCFNLLGKYGTELLSEKFQRVWRDRASDMPFSMHTPYRASWFRPSPTLTSSACRMVHPWLDRPCTVGELADIMGWHGHYPVGEGPVKQIAKGVVPAVGEWIAQQIKLCLEDAWNGEEWDTTYDHHEGKFVGSDSSGWDEKVINLTHYYGHQFDFDRYPEEARAQFRRYNVDPSTGKLVKPWHTFSGRVA